MKRVQQWWPGGLRQRILIGFVVPLALALLTSLVVFRIISAHNQTLRNVTATSQTSEKLSRLIKSVVDAQTGQRGFVITGDEAFLEPYLESGNDFGTTLSQLRRLLPDRESRESLNEIDALFERWHREVAEVSIRLRRAAPLGRDDALREASSAFSEARVAALRFELTGDAALQSRAEELLRRVQQQLERAESLSVSGPQRTQVRAAAAQLARYARVPGGVEGGNAPAPEPFTQALGQDEAQALDDTLAQLAEAAEAAEAAVSADIRAGTGNRLVGGIRTHVEELSDEVNQALERTLAESRAEEQRTQWVAFLGPLFAALVSLLVIVRTQRKLRRSVAKLAEVAKAVAAGQLDRRLSLPRGDELCPLAEDFNRMAAQLNGRERQNAQLAQYSATLQVCTSSDEAHRITAEFGPQLFGGLSGTLYLISASRNLLNGVARWGEHEAPTEAAPVHAPADCWALRRGGPQGFAQGRGVACAHAPTPAPTASLCVPLVNQDETLGVLYLFSFDPGASLDDATAAFAVTVAEALALALSNLRLRESLRQQSVRDPLTGLFNRRHLEETLELELHRAARRGEPLSVVMFDVDHFKNYNDTFGHDAGDVVLQRLSELVQQHIRAGDVACRYGGEEFLLLQPGMSAEHAAKRAETLREAASKLALEHRGTTLRGITLSLGVATYPDHTQSGAELIRRADEALYRAKRSGRNRTEVAGSGVVEGKLATTER